jgi:tRNA pseudouridine55 synthase
MRKNRVHNPNPRQNQQENPNSKSLQGVLLLNKPRGKTAFSLVSLLRKLLNVQKIGHAGTLDPAATGVMVMLIGKKYTARSNEFLCSDKEYLAEIHLGITTDTYDSEGTITQRSDLIPTLAQVEEAISHFQGEISQIPPMFSAKKVNGQKLCDLARKGKEIPRLPTKVSVKFSLLSYNYPLIKARIACSKGTYIRSLAYDLGQHLPGTPGAHLSQLQRVRSGHFDIKECLEVETLTMQEIQGNLKEIKETIKK